MPICAHDPEWLAGQQYPAGKYEHGGILRTAFIVGFQKGVEVNPGWRCFHCGEFFTDQEAARIHFGNTPMNRPGCLHSVEDVGTLRILRDVEQERDELFVRLEARRHGADENESIARWRAQRSKNGKI